MDSKLITVHPNNIVCFLPNSDVLIGIIIPNPLSQHPQPTLSPEDFSKFAAIQMQRLYRYQSFPVLSNKQSSLRFMAGTEKPIWCQSYDGCEVGRSRWTVAEDGMEVEEVNEQWNDQGLFQQESFFQHHHHHHQNMPLPTQFCINLRSLLSCLFPATSIRHYVYVILQSTLCSPVCPAPHLLLAVEVVLLKGGENSSARSKRSCYWLCLEIHFHPTTATPSWRIGDQWNMIYANVLDKQKDGSFVVDKPHERTGSQDEGGIKRVEEKIEHRMACQLIQKHIQFILPKLYTSETGKPLEYRLQTSSKSDLRYLINLATNDIFVAPF